MVSTVHLPPSLPPQWYNIFMHFGITWEKVENSYAKYILRQKLIFIPILCIRVRLFCEKRTRRDRWRGWWHPTEPLSSSLKLPAFSLHKIESLLFPTWNIKLKRSEAQRFFNFYGTGKPLHGYFNSCQILLEAMMSTDELFFLLLPQDWRGRVLAEWACMSEVS